MPENIGQISNVNKNHLERILRKMISPKCEFIFDAFWSANSNLFFFQSKKMLKPRKSVRMMLFPFRRSCPICQTHWKYQLHGFHQFLLFKSTVARVIWKCLIFVLFLLALYYSVYLLNDYVDRRVVTLNTIHQVKRLHFPNITICPKHVDALNFSAIEKDLHFRLPHLSSHQSNQLITFAMAGAGFQHFDAYTQLMKKPEVEEMAKLFRRWRGERGKLEFYQFLFETNGFKCEELFQSCLYGKRKIPCCDLFNPTYVMLRGRCFKMRRFAQTAPDEAGKLTLFFNQMHSPFLDREGIQRQVVAYLSQKEDIPTFPRFYLNDHFWYRLRLKKRRITMLMVPPNPHCSPTRHLKKGNCYVEAWLRERVTGPFNCTIFYMAHKTPELEVCDPEIIFLNYRSVINVISNRSAYQNLTKCLPACERDIIDTQLYSKQFQDQRSSAGAKDAYYHLEASYENLQVEIYEEKLTTTLPGFISQIGGQLSFFLGMSSISLLQFFLIPIANFIMKTLASIRRKFSVKPE